LAIEDELRSIEAALAELLPGLPSNWNGQLTLADGRANGFLGKKLFSCGIEIDAALATDPLRWRTLMHEMLHAHSVGYRKTDFDDNMGWEEGVVEQMQRLLRPTILAKVSVPIDEELLRRADASHLYNPYIEHLEKLREGLGVEDATVFYRELLGVPIKERAVHVAARGRFSPLGYAAFIRLFSETDSRLKTKIRPR
jgi:hypothetical protein